MVFDDTLPSKKVVSSVPAFTTEDRIRILVAEDDRSSQTMFRYMLEADYDVTIVGDGLEALDTLTVQSFDLVLLDLMMPKRDGFSVLTEVRTRIHKEQLPIIIVSALEDGDSVVRALHLGANDYVTKPIDTEVLQARIATQLGLRRLFTEQEQTIKSLALTRDVQRRLCRIITHDLQSPLTNFRMAHYLLRDLTSGNKDVVRVIDNMDVTLNAIVDMIRVFVEAIDAQQLRPTFASVQVAELVGDVIAQHQFSAERKEILLLAETPETLIWGDQRMLNQALSNLLNNAIKFSPTGTEIRVWVDVTAERCRIHVHDQGPGIAEDERADLFVMFNKLSNRPTGGESSTGLGLWIVRQLVDLHDGDCGEYTPDDGGSIFWLEIPLATPEQLRA